MKADAIPAVNTRDPGALAWALLRLPALLIALYVLRHPILATVERAFDVVWITLFAIDLMSTPLSRALLALGVFASLTGLAFALKRLSPWTAYLVSMVVAVIIVVVLMRATGTELRWGLPALILLATNWSPDELFTRMRAQRAPLAIVKNIPGVGEVFFADRYLHWACGLVRGHVCEPAGRLLKALPGAAIAAVALAAFVHGNALVPFEQAMRSGKDAHIVAKGDLNGIALDSGRYLFATGHGAPKLLRYDVLDWSAKPVESIMPTGGSQALAFDVKHREVYVHDTEVNAIIVFNADTLSFVRAIPVAIISPGDAWLSLDPITGTLTLSSEADEQRGAPLLIIDRGSGQILERRGEEAGNLLQHPTKPILYQSFFRRGKGVMAFDLAHREPAAVATSDARVDRMDYDAQRNELYVTSPVEGRILRYDADTLKAKGAFKAIFGVRVLAIDAQRDLMLAGSLTTGKVALVDLKTQKVTKSWYLGPWLRSIVLAPERGRAYVSSNGTLYELGYASP